MRGTRSRTVIPLLGAVGAGFAVSALSGAPTAIAQVCQPGQIVIDGQCVVTDSNDHTAPVHQNGTDGSGMATGTGGDNRNHAHR